MRVISGEAKGTNLHGAPGKGTRPTADKVKESVFSIIGPYFAGGFALDLFAGTGALGIEALSRGIDHALFIDIDKQCVDVIRRNLQKAGFFERAEVYRNEAGRALHILNRRNMKFDLVFLDPPYRIKTADKLMANMQRHALLKEEATVMVEHDASHTYERRIDSLELIRHVVYGDTAISIYRK